MTRIAVGLGHDLYAYRLNVTSSQANLILEHFILRTNALAEEPRFYNTLSSNCTNELAEAVNEAYPGTLPWRSYYILTGSSAEYLYEEGFIKAQNEKFDDLKNRSEISDQIRHFSQAQINKIARQLNERPRKTLQFETPAEKFNQCVAAIS